MVEAGERLLEGRAPWYRQWVSRRDPSDPFWSPMRLGDAVERVQVPVLLQSGWQDLFLQQTFEQYARLSTRGVNVALTVGPWTHVQLFTKGGHIMVTETLGFLGEHLAGTGVRTRAAPVKVFVTGAEQWRDLDRWPPPTEELTLHPQPDGGLGDDPAPDGSRAGFTYDPADPTPTIGGRLLAQGGGYADDRELANRADVATFTGPVLTAPLEVLGAPVMVLAHASDNPHADLYVRAVGGRSRRTLAKCERGLRSASTPPRALRPSDSSSTSSRIVSPRAIGSASSWPAAAIPVGSAIWERTTIPRRRLEWRVRTAPSTSRPRTSLLPVAPLTGAGG